MPRINTIEPNQAQPKATELMVAAEKSMGRVPNLLKTLAHSPAALESFMTLNEVLSRGELTPSLREQVALVSAAANGCDYCASAHTAIGKSLKIDPAEIDRNLAGESSDPRTAAVLSFVQSILNTRGDVSDSELDAAREAGLSDSEITEVVAHIALNTLTNYFNRLAQIEIDFPKVELTSVGVA